MNRLRRQSFVFLALATLGFAAAGQAQVYKCTVKGATVYQDAPCGTARGSLATATAATAIPPPPAPVAPRWRSTAPRSPEFAPGTVLEPPSNRGPLPLPPPTARVSPVQMSSSARPREQTPYIARAPAADLSSSRVALSRAVEEQRAMQDQQRAEMDQLRAKWRSQPGANTMEADMEAYTRRWQWRDEAARAKVEAASKELFAACPAGMSRSGGSCR